MPTTKSDTITVEAVDPRWVRANWAIGDQTVRRAAKSLGTAFHNAQFVMRVFEASGGGSSPTMRLLSEHSLPDDTAQWFAEVPTAGKRYRVVVGFASGGEFYAAASSDLVTTPKSGEQRAGSRVPLSAEILSELRDRSADQPRPRVEVTAELVLKGRTRLDTTVSCDETPVQVDRNGHFTVTQRLETGRQIVPLELTHREGEEPDLVVAAVEFSLRKLGEGS